MLVQISDNARSIQFSGQSEAKLRRLAEEISRIVQGLNKLIDEFNTLTDVVNEPPEVLEHALVGPKHTAAGLTAGNVLKALSATSFGFAPLRFAELYQVDPATFVNPQQGYVLTFHDGYYSMRPNAAEIADTVITQGSGISITFTGLEYIISADFSSLWTEVEIDFGSTSVRDFSFQISDPLIQPASKVAVLPCGKPATGRGADDWQWDTAVFAAEAASGFATVRGMFMPGPVIGKRKIQYQVV